MQRLSPLNSQQKMLLPLLPMLLQMMHPRW
jgi:hypothetical protein